MQRPHASKAPLPVTTFTLLALAVFLIGVSAPPATAQRSDKKQRFTDEDLQVEKAAGKGVVSTAPDSKQTNDPSVPVVVRLVNTYYGGGQHVGRIKILEAKIENRHQKVTQSIQLRWALAKKAEPDAVLLEGVTPFFEAQVAPYEAPLLDIPPIYYNKIVKPLLKGGQMDDDIRLTVGIQEVRFEDGTRWQRTRQAAFLKATFGRPPPVLQSRYITPAHYLSLPTLRNPQSRLFRPKPYEWQPRLTASAILLAFFRIADPPCRNNMNCGYNPVC